MPPFKGLMTQKGGSTAMNLYTMKCYDCVICPNNKVSKYSTTNRDGYKEFKSSFKDCENSISR